MKSKLVIGVDGRPLSGPLSGIGRFLTQTLINMPSDEVDIRISCRKPISTHFSYVTELPFLEITQVPSLFGLPVYKSRQEDVFWGPAHRLPIGLPPNLPAVVTVHDLVWKKFSHTMRARTRLGEMVLFSKAINRADQIICISQATATELRQFFPHVSAKINMIYPGVLDRRSDPAPASILAPFILFVGTVEPRKNLVQLLEAFADLSPRILERYKLVIAGNPGWGGVDIKKVISSKGLEGRVTVFESPNDDQLHSLYANCSFLVLPSLHEGFGLPIIEAMNYGKPIVTSQISAMPEVVGSAGLLVDPHSRRSITHAMQTLIEDPTTYERLKENAGIEVRRFNWQVTSRNHLNVFHDAIATSAVNQSQAD